MLTTPISRTLKKKQLPKELSLQEMFDNKKISQETLTNPSQGCLTTSPLLSKVELKSSEPE
jgi:hypothetical protein